MKLPIQQLAPHLSKTLAPIYMISGDEPLLAQEALDLIRDAAKKAEFSERIRIDIEPGADWGKLFYSNAQSFSLFSTKRILELDLTNAKLNAASSKILQEYAKNPSADILLLIRTNKVDSKTEQTVWYKALDKVSVMIPIWPITIDQLPAWITQRAKKLGLNITKGAAELLATQVEGNLLAAAQELEKLRLLQNTDTIDQQTIENAVSDNAHFDIFALVESSLAGNIKRSLRILENLNAEDTEPTLVLWALTRELRTMADMARQVKQGIGLSTLFSKYRIWDKRQPAVRAFLQRHKQEDCWELLVQSAQIDRTIKGAETGDIWVKLQQLVSTINLPRACHHRSG